MNSLKSLKISLLKICKYDILQEFFYSGIGCIIIIIIYNIFPKNYYFSANLEQNQLPKIVLFIIILSFILIFLILNQPYPRKKFFKISYKRNIILFSIFNFSIIYFIFFNTYYSFFGIGVDNWYRSAFITHMAKSGYPQDYCYKGLSAYYFPLYYFFLALIARLLQIEGFKMVRYGFLFMCYLIPIILYEAWKKIYDKRISFVITVLSIVTLQDVFQIDKLIVFLLMIPYFIYYFENYSNKIFRKRDYILAGIFGSFLLTIYLSFLLFIPIYYAISLFQNKREFKKNFWHVVKISFLIITFSSWYLIPLLKDYIFLGFEVHQNNFFYSYMTEIPIFTQIYPFSILGFLLFIGLIYIIKNYSISRDFKILGNLLISLLLLIFIGLIGFALKNPFFLSYRFFKIPRYILIISTSIYGVKFFDFLSHNENKTLSKINLKCNFQMIKVYILIIFACFYVYNNSLISTSLSNYKTALEEEPPKDEIAIIKELEYKDKVFLLSYTEVCPYISIYLFLCPTPDYSHPSAHHNKRIDFIIELSESKSSESFYDKILDCEFDIIDYFYLEPHGDDFVFYAKYDKFNHQDKVSIIFERRLFEDSDKFEEIEIDDEIIFRTIY